GEALRLTPPPGFREPLPTPVLLRVHLGIGELPRLITHDGCSECLPTQQPRMPVLVEGGHHLEDAGTTRRTVGPGRQIGEADSQARIGAQIHPEPAPVALEGAVTTF